MAQVRFSEDALLTAPNFGTSGVSCYCTAKLKQAGLTELAEPYENTKVPGKPSTTGVNLKSRRGQFS
jgi:hypothetical protein